MSLVVFCLERLSWLPPLLPLSCDPFRMVHSPLASPRSQSSPLELFLWWLTCLDPLSYPRSRTCIWCRVVLVLWWMKSHGYTKSGVLKYILYSYRIMHTPIHPHWWNRRFKEIKTNLLTKQHQKRWETTQCLRQQISRTKILIFAETRKISDSYPWGDCSPRVSAHFDTTHDFLAPSEPSPGPK